jgi:hypothetical protein
MLPHQRRHEYRAIIVGDVVLQYQLNYQAKVDERPIENLTYRGKINAGNHYESYLAFRIFCFRETNKYLSRKHALQRLVIDV